MLEESQRNHYPDCFTYFWQPPIPSARDPRSSAGHTAVADDGDDESCILPTLLSEMQLRHVAPG